MVVVSSTLSPPLPPLPSNTMGDMGHRSLSPRVRNHDPARSPFSIILRDCLLSLAQKFGFCSRSPSTLMGIRFPRPPVSVTRRDICRQYRGAGSLPCKRPNMNVPSFRFSGTDNLRGLLIQCCDYRGVGIRIRIRGVIGNTSGEYQPFPRRLEIYLETVAPGGLVCAQVRLVLIPKSEKPPAILCGGICVVCCHSIAGILVVLASTFVPTIHTHQNVWAIRFQLASSGCLRIESILLHSPPLIVPHPSSNTHPAGIDPKTILRGGICIVCCTGIV
mmetsp:Transcript_16313/g.18791  ORF Transcript_16313/g.18791 Transcript_16313/m.18791 type:complete len:275 (-) Transcript_16313:162-986(-)